MCCCIGLTRLAYPNLLYPILPARSIDSDVCSLSRLALSLLLYLVLPARFSLAAVSSYTGYFRSNEVLGAYSSRTESF